MIEGPITDGDQLVLPADLFHDEELVAVSGFGIHEGEELRWSIIGSQRPEWWSVEDSKLRAEARRVDPSEVGPVPE